MNDTYDVTEVTSNAGSAGNVQGNECKRSKQRHRAGQKCAVKTALRQEVEK